MLVAETVEGAPGRLRNGAGLDGGPPLGAVADGVSRARRVSDDAASGDRANSVVLTSR